MAQVPSWFEVWLLPVTLTLAFAAISSSNMVVWGHHMMTCSRVLRALMFTCVLQAALRWAEGALRKAYSLHLQQQLGWQQQQQARQDPMASSSGALKRG